MARGDQARKAAHRHAVAEHEQALAAYQHRVAKLTADNRDLREQLAARDRAAKQTERRLRAERDEGVAPQVQALTLSIRSAIERRDEAQREAKTQTEQFHRLVRHVNHHLQKQDGLSAVAALDVLAQWCWGVGGTVQRAEALMAVRMGNTEEANVAIDRIRHAQKPDRKHALPPADASA